MLHLSLRLLLATLGLLPGTALAQFTTPHTIAIAGDVTATLGGTTFINHGLQGVGRIDGSSLDPLSETFGSVSGLQITGWTGTPETGFRGTFNILPDRGYNHGDVFSAYAARIQQVDFAFEPSKGELKVTAPIRTETFTYHDPTHGQSKTTGIDPAIGQAAFFTPPTVVPYAGALTLDSEALVLKPDGSGYIGDEYGPNIYYFNPRHEIVGVITPPEAFRPRVDSRLNFNSLTPPQTGRRNNQGFEGVALSPDGTKLFALPQSALMQDTAGTDRSLTRLLVYDVAIEPTPTKPVAEYILQLPSYTPTGDGSPATTTASQNEIVALDDHRLLVLARDSSGQGSPVGNPSVYKCILLVDLTIGDPTNIAGSGCDEEGRTVIDWNTNALDSRIQPVTWTEAINLLNLTQLVKIHLELDAGGESQVTKSTLSEKWEGMSLVPAHDPAAPHDFFLFIANDNDFFTSTGHMLAPDGAMQEYNAFAKDFPAHRIPLPSPGANTTEHDTIFLVYRVTITP